jgi:O-antigen/teichoic acid export membrane protein
MTFRALGARLRAQTQGGSSIAVAMAVTNVATYGFTMIAARVLGPRYYGAFAALMAMLLITGVLQLGLQATAARRIAAEPQHVGQIEQSILRVTYRASLALGALLLLASPLVNQLLRLDSLLAAALVAVACVPNSIVGGQAGILQGERRWRPLAAVYLGVGIPRLVVGSVMIAWRPTVETAMLGVTVALFVPVVIGWFALRTQRPAHGQLVEPDSGHSARAVVRETVHNSQALLALFALSNVDVVIARNVLDEHQAGLYAAGLIMVKAVLFLPQFVVIVAFPSMSSPTERRRALVRSLSLVAVLGGLAVAAAGLFSGLALVFVGGDEYAEIQSLLWVFAALGTLLAMLQLLVYSVLARRGQRSVYAVWAALALMVALGLMASTVGGLLTVVIATDALLFAALLVATLLILQRAPTTATEPVEATR